MKKLVLTIFGLFVFFFVAGSPIYAQECTVPPGTVDDQLNWVWGTNYVCTGDYPKIVWNGSAYVTDNSGCSTYTGWVLQTTYFCVLNGVYDPSSYTCCNTTSDGSPICQAQTTPCGENNPPVGGGDDTGGGGDDTTGPYCGDLSCNGTETCATCVSDCGACAMSGTGRARAKLVSSDATSCADVTASSTYISATFGLSPAATTQVAPGNGSYATWTNVPITAGGTTFYLSPLASGQYVQKLACWTRDNPAGNGTGTGVNVTANGSTVTWEVGYTLGTPWVQAEGGDVYASATLRSYVPSVATVPVFVNDGTGAYPGVVSYGTSYDFNSSLSDQGDTSISSTNWLAYAPHTTVDYYDYFYRRFGSPTTPSVFADLLAVEQPASSEAPYYVVGDMTTTNDWVVGDNESLIFIVDGNVTIGGSITTVGSGFVAFIVNGDIVVDTTVGTAYNSRASVLDGIYITSPTGTLDTGPTTAAPSARFVGEGMFIAGDFLLQRDLEQAGATNTTHASELFIYDPQLLFTMPDPMKELPVTWQEVAP